MSVGVKLIFKTILHLYLTQYNFSCIVCFTYCQIHNSIALNFKLIDNFYMLIKIEFLTIFNW